MARTTSAAVQGVLMDDYGKKADGSFPSLDPFISSANVVVTRVATCAVAKSKTLTAAELELIERWLAAHFYAVSDKPYTSKSTQGASASFNGQTAMALDATLYGQQAKVIDYSGCLESISKRQMAALTWLGKAPSDQVDYADRD
jgi:hypothetical protein